MRLSGFFFFCALLVLPFCFEKQNEKRQKNTAHAETIFAPPPPKKNIKRPVYLASPVHAITTPPPPSVYQIRAPLPAYQTISTRSYHAELSIAERISREKEKSPRPPLEKKIKEKGGTAGAFGLVR